VCQHAGTPVTTLQIKLLLDFSLADANSFGGGQTLCGEDAWAQRQMLFPFPAAAAADPAFPSSYWMHAGCSAFGPFAVPYRRFQMVSRNAATG
jgi:hypothetical protein